MENSKIEWTKHTANLWSGCTKVHEGCDNCYAETLSHRWGNDVWGNDKPRLEVKSVWNNLLKFQKEAKKLNEIHSVFVGSMMDIFEKPMDVIDSKGEKKDCHCDNCNGVLSTEHFRQWFFNSVVPSSPNLQFLLLTKRPSNINKYIPEEWKTNPPTNVIFGTSPVNQTTFNKLVSQLCEVNGRRFLSVEPQLDYVNIEEWCKDKIHWIIQGGESGHHKRPFNIQWAYSMKQDCKELNIPYFFKQIDKIQPVPSDLLDRQFPKPQPPIY